MTDAARCMPRPIINLFGPLDATAQMATEPLHRLDVDGTAVEALGRAEGVAAEVTDQPAYRVDLEGGQRVVMGEAVADLANDGQVLEVGGADQAEAVGQAFTLANRVEQRFALDAAAAHRLDQQIIELLIEQRRAAYGDVRIAAALQLGERGWGWYGRIKDLGEEINRPSILSYTFEELSQTRKEISKNNAVFDRYHR